MRRQPRLLLLSLFVLLLINVVPTTAFAFCGFYVAGSNAELYNDATQVVLMRDGLRTVLSMQNHYQGPPQGFAMVVPVPVVLSKENVKTLPGEVFDRVDKLDAPRLVEYWEQDPCRPAYPESPPSPVMAAPEKESSGKARDLGVKVEAKFSVGEYDIVILSAKDSSGLETWLSQEKYSIPNGSEPYLRPYVQRGSKFFVAKVDPKRVKFEGNRAVLSPIRFHYDSEQFALPVRLGLVNSKDAQDLIIHILAKDQRYEVANYPNVFIPTNLEVNESTKGQFAPFYAALFDRTLEKNPRAIVTEYAWQAGSCDPCPTPPLELDTLAALGADVLPSVKSKEDPNTIAQSFVLTRLHARYTKASLGADLVFKAAPGIRGGREFMGTNGQLERGAEPSDGQNNFQARYIIRHPWTGPVTCKDPTRNVWGGPPDPNQGSGAPEAAQNLAYAPRGKVALGTFIREDNAELDVKAVPAKEGDPPLGVVVPPPAHTCGCNLVTSTHAFGAASIGAFAGLFVLLGRRRRSQ